MEEKEPRRTGINNIDTISTILIFFIFCGYFGHSSTIYIHRIPAYLLFALSSLKIFANVKSINKYKINIKYCIWYGIFIVFNLLSIIWTIDKTNSIDLVKSMIITFIYIFGIMGYITDKEKLKNVMKILLFSYLYMCLRIIFFETAKPWTFDFGSVVGLHFNRIAVSLSYGVLIAFYFLRKEKKYRYVIPIIIFYYIIYLTGSRKGLLMPICFVGIFLLLNMGKNLKKITTSIIIVCLSLLIIVPIGYNNTIIRTKFESLYKSIMTEENTKDGSIREREYYRETAMKLFKERPIIGIGTNGFRAYLEQIKYRGTIAYSHCNYTELLATLGIIGFILYYSLYFYILKDSLYKYNSNNLAIILCLSFIVVQTIFEYGFVSFYMLEFQLLIVLMLMNSQMSEKKNEKYIKNKDYLKKRVVTIIPSLNTGGSERTAVALANYLANNGVESYLINLGINDNNYEIDDKVIAYHKSTEKGSIKKIKSYIDTIRYLNRVKPDIIFEMLFTPIKYALINKFFNKKVIIIGSERNNPEKYKNLKYKILCKICPILCDGYIFQTQKVKEMFSKKIQKKSIVIGNAISNPDVYDIRTYDQKEKIIVNVGRLHYQKGQDILIKAFNKVHREFPEYKLIIYGEDKQRENLERLIKDLKLQESVFLLGKCKNYLENVAKAEIFIMTSRYEGMPNALLEAMAIGMPCISTDCVAGPSEIIEDGKNGLLVEVDNIDEIADKLIYLIQNKEVRETLGEKAKLIKNKYSVENIYRKYYHYFLDVLDKKQNENRFLKKIFMKLEYWGFTNIIPDKMYLKILYKYRINSELNLDNPKTFNEKLQWLKLYDRKDIYTSMVDKYEAKKYVANIIGNEFIIPTLGVYNSFEEIDFNQLPNQFVIKCTHDSGGLVICKDKNKLDIKYAKEKINRHLKTSFYYHAREWPYKNVKPRIIIEKYMQNEQDTSLKDYKFYCFHGTPKYLYVSEGLEDHSTAKISFFDMDFNFVEFGRSDFSRFEEKPEKPLNFEKMVELAKKLSKDMIFVRVDFYEINKTIYFSELTFSPCGGFMPFEPKVYDERLGELLKLPIQNK